VKRICPSSVLFLCGDPPAEKRTAEKQPAWQYPTGKGAPPPGVVRNFRVYRGSSTPADRVTHTKTWPAQLADLARESAQYTVRC
jgi:hypothetical protein